MILGLLFECECWLSCVVWWMQCSGLVGWLTSEIHSRPTNTSLPTKYQPTYNYTTACCKFQRKTSRKIPIIPYKKLITCKKTTFLFHPLFLAIWMHNFPNISLQINSNRELYCQKFLEIII